MKVSKIPGLGNYGIYVDDVDFQNLDIEEWMEIGKLHMQNLVTIIRNHNCTKEQLGELIVQFGDIRVTAYTSKKYKEKYNKDWNWVVAQAKLDSNLIDDDDKFRILSAEQVAEHTPNGFALMKVAGGYTNGLPNGFFAEGDLLWHSNESGTRTFTPGVALMGWKNMVGSSTGFMTTPDYYESVSESFRSELDDMIIQHRFIPGKINPGADLNSDKLMHVNMCPDDDNEIPMVIKSPGGITGLHYSINTVYSIKGATKQESDAVFAKINKELFVEKYTYDHWYAQDNDLLLFDNSITLHNRQGFIEGRLAYRLSHDYGELQNEVYQPYFQAEYQKLYNQEITDIVKRLGLKNFKLPKTRFIDHIPVIRNYF